MTPTPRIAAMDFGLRRVGLAVTDPLRLFAQPLGTFTPDGAVERLRALRAAPEGLERVVVGWPLEESGEEGAAVERVQPFVNRLRRALKGVEVAVQDERHSSRRAAEALVAAGVKKKDRRQKGRLDAAAAAVILQDYLEEHGSPAR
ncbi:MAG TPA: Holliday junction resolvase RuvX [Rubricoccaceae bacterium]|nr:Holliday junction resolvase RuvX [Rubricoccaceae bacterium]